MEATKLRPGVSPERLKDLKKPFPVKWRVQSMKGNKVALCVAYIDARDVENRLDDVVGMENWMTETKVEKNNLYTKLSILVNGAWIHKSDVGVESNIEPAKGEVSDSLKRAGVQWGIGRFLYDLEIMKLPVLQYKGGKYYPAKHDKKTILFDAKQLTDYCNSLVKLKSKGQGAIQDNSILIAEYVKTVCDALSLLNNEKEIESLYANAKAIRKNETFLKVLKEQLEKVRNGSTKED